MRRLGHACYFGETRVRFTARFDVNDRRGFSSVEGLTTSGFGWSFEYELDVHSSLVVTESLFVAVDGWIVSRDGQSAERLLEAHQEDSLSSYEHLNGEFVGVVIDTKLNEIRFLRDRVGVRPLYMNSTGRRRVVASSVKQIVDEPYVSREIDEEEVTFRLARLSPNISSTVYQQVKAIAPGTLLTLTENRHSQERALTWDHVDRTALTRNEAADVSRATVSLALDASTPDPSRAGYELSGGLDSSSLVGLAASSHGADNVLAGRILFEDSVADERRFSQAVIDHWGLESIDVAPMIPSQEQLATWVKELAHPVPLANATMSAVLHSGFAETGRDVVVTGVGGDDAFADMGSGTRLIDALRTRDRESLSRFGADIRADPRREWGKSMRPGIVELLGRRNRRDPLPWISDRAKEQYDVRSAFRARPKRVSRWRAIDDRWERFTEGPMARILEDLALLEQLGWLRLTHPFIAPEVVEATYGFHPDLPVIDGEDRAVQRVAFADVLPALLQSRRSKAEFSSMGWQAFHASGGIGELLGGPLSASGLVDLDYLNTRRNDATNHLGAVLPLLQLASIDRWLRSIS